MESKVYVEVGSIRLEEETETPIMLLQQPLLLCPIKEVVQLMK